MLLTMEVEEDCPESFIKFLRLCKELSIRLKWSQHSTPIPPFTQVNRTSVKKLQESINFGHFIADFCFNHFSEEDIKKTTVVDIGCGLGYVSSQLYKKGFHVIGVDARPDLCVTANSRIGTDRMSFVHHFVSDSQETQEFIDNLVPEGNNGVIIALHGCGDLLDHVINLFCRSKRFKGLFCVTCCYHKIDKKKFPRSDLFRESCQEHGLRFDPVSLRSACQKTPISWTIGLTAESLDIHSKSAAFRGILEEVQIQTNYSWKKTKSRMKKTNDLQDYVDQAILGFPVEKRTEALKLLQETITKHQDKLNRVKTLKILQTLIQPIVESVVVLDHVVKLREQELKATAAQVFSQNISPRNTAVIALK